MSDFTYTASTSNDWKFTASTVNDWKFTVSAGENSYLTTKPGGFILTTKSGENLKYK